MKKIIKLFVALTFLMGAGSISAIDTSHLTLKGKMQITTYFYGNNNKVVRKGVMDVSFIEDTENEDLYICFGDLMGISMGKRSAIFVLEEIEMGIKIEADNIKKPIGEKNFKPRAVDPDSSGIGIDFIPVLKNWNKHFVYLIIGTAYTKKIKDFRLVFCVNEFKDDESVGRGYFYFTLDHDEIRTFQKIFQDYVKNEQ